MYILYYRGEGIKFMSGVKEYMYLSEELATPQEIEDKCAPGFRFVRGYDTDIDQDFTELPLDTILIPHH